MPAPSKSSQRLFQAAEHGATFPKAKKIRASMTREQMHDFASGSMKGKPEHVRARHNAARMSTKHSPHHAGRHGGSVPSRHMAHMQGGNRYAKMLK